MKHGMTSLGGNLYARKDGEPGDYLTLFGPLGQAGKLSLSDNQAWELLQVFLGDIERLAATQHADVMDEEQQQIVALHQVHQALSYEAQSEEDLAWLGDFETKRATVDRGLEAAAAIRKAVDTWGMRLVALDTAMENAELLLADEQAEEAEKTNQGATLWDGEDNRNMPAS